MYNDVKNIIKICQFPVGAVGKALFPGKKSLDLYLTQNKNAIHIVVNSKHCNILWPSIEESKIGMCGIRIMIIT